ncbi:rhodanese-like domain-containing protein [Frigoribacterium faeni]|uniref:Rhodanese-like protein n=1 Tax=Frigoribacterium faeni TaxID=145483 RepID=A0A7W3JHC6_9MICO|nr:rhodanese-like domain-containing protein [Frigoribacterium faeni]MBA8812828.1 rhodanese-related sulfurtransferase [Frigoribacterium faeni]BFF13956.1 rhodanese-like domain-containing protein [Microbacterium flavescens]GEK82456.1 rhodanese-like protein [Frigoribacterium faeni]
MNARDDLPGISAAEAVSRVASGARLIDVREQSEWDAGHAPAAQLIPLSELGDRVDDVPTDEQVLIVCHAGMRSLRATAALRRAGIDAVNVEGGMLAWRDAEGELVSETGAPASVD